MVSAMRSALRLTRRVELRPLQVQVPGAGGQQDGGRAQAEGEAHAHGQAPPVQRAGRAPARGSERRGHVRIGTRASSRG